MRKYIKILKIEFLKSLQYRFEYISELATTALMIAVNIFLWNAVYLASNTNEIASYTRKDMAIYLTVTNLLVSIFSFTEITRLGHLIKSGRLTSKLIKPYSVKLENIITMMGSQIDRLFIFLVIIIISRFIGLKFNLLLLILLVISSFVMHAFLKGLISCFGFWMLETWPLRGLFNGIFYILSGTNFPLDILPKPIYEIVKYNPFAIVSYAISKTIQNNFSNFEIVKYIIAALIWIIIFNSLYSLLIKKGLKTYEGMGS